MHDFEWNERKAGSNLTKHGVSFEAAKLVFEDTFAVELPVEVTADGEERYTLIGMIL
ncbi:BrnT family toxin [Mesorhizobium sp. LHD-90]|uniref:BrnT family toxin n=1 Tax=Mesorhizobium sp. LHD-90 TaxID=3071414 RepID=UPI0027E1F4CB|nr:BrnT family toxin [Mesorhizobium sp. LHD-90]MDQ6438336.1 BrnT family toxin [Mesorhizobium sp. LHD-90]